MLEDGPPVTEVAMRHGVSRQTVHTWLRRYREAGMAGLVDRSRRPPRCAHQITAKRERMMCDLRRHNPRWGRWRLVHEPRRQGVAGIPGRTSMQMDVVSFPPPSAYSPPWGTRRAGDTSAHLLGSADKPSGPSTAEDRPADLVSQPLIL